MFQSTPPHGGRPISGFPISQPKQFQSTPPHGGRLYLGVTSMSGVGFNPRPRMGGDTLRLNDCDRWDRFQSTPPHGGRPVPPSISGSFISVSIHAPAWGATISGQPNFGAIPVSIHAPAWGATIFDFINATVKMFQSTPPHGGRRLYGKSKARW